MVAIIWKGAGLTNLKNVRSGTRIQIQKFWNKSGVKFWKYDTDQCDHLRCPGEVATNKDSTSGKILRFLWKIGARQEHFLFLVVAEVCMHFINVIVLNWALSASIKHYNTQEHQQKTNMGLVHQNRCQTKFLTSAKYVTYYLLSIILLLWVKE